MSLAERASDENQCRCTSYVSNHRLGTSLSELRLLEPDSSSLLLLLLLLDSLLLLLSLLPSSELLLVLGLFTLGRLSGLFALLDFFRPRDFS